MTDSQHKDPSFSIRKKMRSATIVAVVVSLTLIIIKSIAWIITDSIAILSSLIDSSLDCLASIINFFAVRHATTPADREHRFGHSKTEALATLFQGLLITGSAIFLIIESVKRIIKPEMIEQGAIGIAIIFVSILLTFALILFQKRVVRETGSLIIEADSLHYKGDLYTNISVIIAIILTFYLGITYADSILGFIIALFLIKNIQSIIMQAINQLMDSELPDETREKIKEIILSHPQTLGLHDLRTRASGTQKFIQCHVELDGHLSLIETHEISDAIESAIIKIYPEAEVLIHQDPAGYEEITALERS